MGTKFLASLLSAASLLALTLGAYAQSDANSTETVVVTGSRVISNAANSPTPLTSVSLSDLQATTPTDVSDALNKLPVFQASLSPRGNTNASQNASGNVLNLRYFGPQRTLVLLDGNRVAPSNANGTVDIDTLPQMLMTRVDVVTGGASAVYGSDAVTGVVNFVLDHHFSGVKFDINSGISTYSDAASYQAGIAAGLDLLGGRGHFEMSLRHFHQDGVRIGDRPETSDGNDWGHVGPATAASPSYLINYGRNNSYTFGGLIGACGGCAANGKQFISDGIIGPVDKGAPTSVSTTGIGGDGVYTTQSSITASLTTEQSFARFSYNLDDTTTAYVEATAAQSYNAGGFQNNYIQVGSVPNTFFTNNAYLSPAAQASLANPTGKFQLYKYINNQGPTGGFRTVALNRNLDVNAGIDGTLWGKYDWHAFYSHGESRGKVDDPHNQNNAHMYAAEDAVLNSAGNIVCYVSTTAYASLYPGCEPMNPFGPTALTSQQWQYMTQDTYFIMTNVMDDTGANISGELFNLPAGPVKAALSGEMRWLSLGDTSNAPPVNVNCTGLRICAATPYWQGNVAANMPTVRESVWEFAGETDIPVLKDVPLVQSFDVNLAGRYTDYSTSGAVETWKVGLDYHVNDDLRFRATTSVDIRAPTLNDLFAPTQYTHEGFTDYHLSSTGVAGNTQLDTESNPNLVPEVARTYTAGVVLTPTFFPGFTASVDYFRIGMKNAISAIQGGNATLQQTCEASNGTSPYCALVLRPLPFSDRSLANFATDDIKEVLNAAFQRTEGMDIELNYGFEMADIISSVPGAVTMRILGTVQPYNASEPYPGSPLTFIAASKGRVTSMLSYAADDWTFTLADRWLSNYMHRTTYTQVYAVPRVPSRNYDDITIGKKFTVEGAELNSYLSIQNVLNIRPPLESSGGTGNLYYLGYGDQNSNTTAYDAIGRYFTIGLRGNL